MLQKQIRNGNIPALNDILMWYEMQFKLNHLVLVSGHFGAAQCKNRDNGRFPAAQHSSPKVRHTYQGLFCKVYFHILLMLVFFSSLKTIVPADLYL
jgi:hypothetical protein